MEVLNTSLYRALCRHFGEEAVTVSAEGQKIDWVVRNDAMQAQSQRKPRREVRNSGEEYVVRCPFCKDHRQRLWINHLWGHTDPATGQRNLWLAQCWNEQCLSEYANQQKLFHWIYVQGGANSGSRIVEGKKPESRKLGEVAPAGTLTKLSDLVKHTPNHHALTYLQDRYFDPLKLERLYGIRYCSESRYMHAQDRLYAPIRKDGKLVGWQCRYIGDDVQGRSFNEMGIPKYYTCPAMPRKLIAYNMERAMLHPTIVVVEGVTDVWNVGPMCMGLLSNKMALPLMRYIARTMKKRWGSEAAIVVMLDPEWDDRARKKNEHPIDKLVMQFRQKCQMEAVAVWLPEGNDPGSLDRAISREMAVKAGRKLRIPVTFSRPPCKLQSEG
jgi:hypothetical protein